MATCHTVLPWPLTRCNACVLAQDVYSDDKVDTEAIRACLNELAAWRRRAMEDLQHRVALMHLDGSNDADEHGSMAASDSDAAADMGLAGMDATGSGPEDDVSEGERWD